MLIRLKKRALCAPALAVCLAFGAAVAQDEPGQTRGPIPGVEAAEEYVPPPTEPVAPSAPAPAPAPAKAAEAPAEQAGKMPWEAVAPSSEELPTPVVDEVAQTDIPEKAPPKGGKPQKVKKERAPKEPREPVGLDGLRLGFRAGLGTGGLDGHKALVDEGYNEFAIILKPSVSVSAGLSASYAVLEFLDAVVEAQYALYKAHGEFVVNVDDQDYRDLYTAGAVLHALEFPILARFHAEPLTGLPLYAEGGLSVGANLYSYIYKGAGYIGKPIANYAAGGAVLGVGYEVEGVQLGLRGNYVFTRYAKNVHGRPWAVQAAATYYFLGF